MNTLLPPPRRRTRVIAVALGIPFLAGLTLLTLTPTRVEQAMPNLLDLVLRGIHRVGLTSIDFTRLEIIANVVVFIPVGILAFLLIPRQFWGWSILVGPLISTGIELTQLVVLTNRAATINDVIANSAGASIGVALAIACTLLFAPRNSPRSSPTLEAL